jgi:thiamine-monophosphate kinase
LLRVNLSDLAAKAADPYGYFLAVSWPSAWTATDRESFARGLAEDGEAFDLTLLGGDTTSTSGPMTASVTMLGWVPEGRMIRRAGARPGDHLYVSGPIGDGGLGLMAARGEIDDEALALRYRLPTPRLDLHAVLRAQAVAAADVSDGLIADARHIAEASGVRLRLWLESIPLSAGAERWLDRQSNYRQAMLWLASAGDDYELVCVTRPMIGCPEGLFAIGDVVEGEGVAVLDADEEVPTGPGGWRHG